MLTLRTLSLAERDAVLAVKPAYPCTLEVVARIEWPRTLLLEGIEYFRSRAIDGEAMIGDVGPGCRYVSQEGYALWLRLDGTVWLNPRNGAQGRDASEG